MEWSYSWAFRRDWKDEYARMAMNLRQNTLRRCKKPPNLAADGFFEPVPEGTGEDD